MAYFDVFNGDADGICALHQLRLHEPRDSVLVTGVKREIDLLRRVEAGAGDVVTVLDISMAKNTSDLLRLLDQGAVVEYFDHHQAGEIPAHDSLHATIDTHAEVCTSLLVNGHLENAYRIWAVVGAFGDNLDNSARMTAAPLALSDDDLGQLRQLGICLNYNGYGVSLEDLFFTPDELYRRVHPYKDPMAFMNTETYKTLDQGYLSDMARARNIAPELVTGTVAVYRLPTAAWANRVSGVFGNELAQEAPDRAHAMVTTLADGNQRISVRAPLNRKEGADTLCSAFPSGGGRKGAAGINCLPADQYEQFLAAFQKQYDK